MTNYSVKNVSEYISAAPTEARPHLREIRAAVKSALPKAEEKIGYGKPYYKTTRWVVGFDAYTPTSVLRSGTDNSQKRSTTRLRTRDIRQEVRRFKYDLTRKCR